VGGPTKSGLIYNTLDAAVAGANDIELDAADFVMLSRAYWSKQRTRLIQQLTG